MRTIYISTGLLFLVLLSATRLRMQLAMWTWAVSLLGTEAAYVTANAFNSSSSTAPDGQPEFRPTVSLGAGDEWWQTGLDQHNVPNGTVNAMVWAGTTLYIGGEFTRVGQVLANGVAKWDGKVWTGLGTGIGNSPQSQPLAGSGMSVPNVLSLAVAPNGDLYVGGRFDQAGAIAANNLAKWNGKVWTTVGQGVSEGCVWALAVWHNGVLYVGGRFARAGGKVVSGVASWDGAAWHQLGAGLVTDDDDGAGRVAALAVASNGYVYAGGYFLDKASGAYCMARWDGKKWNAMGGREYGSGVDGQVGALAVADNGDVYVGGSFERAGGQFASNLAKWNGKAWSVLGGPNSNTVGVRYGGRSPTCVQALAVASNGDVYVGGRFSVSVGSRDASNLIRWNGRNWSALGTGLNDDVNALALGGQQLYAGGRFTAVGDSSKAVKYFGSYDLTKP